MTRQEALHELYTIFGYGFYNERVDEALNMAIKALEQEPSEDCISRQAAIDGVKTLHDVAWKKWHEPMLSTNVVLDMIRELPTAQPFTAEQIQTMQELESAQVEKAYELGKADRPKWIPVSWHETTEEERAENGYPKNWVVLMDCEMPSDEQEILVTTRYGTVEKDVCYEDGEFSLDSGYDWIDDVIAWMPLPEAYREEEQ